MPGEITLGAVVGLNQSFDAGTLDPWSKASDQASAYAVAGAGAVHSSAWGLHTVTGSTGGGTALVTCALGAPSLAGAVAFPGSASHRVWSWVWGRAMDAPSSGGARWRIAADSDAWSAPIAHGDALARYTAEAVTSDPSTALSVVLERTVASGATMEFALDDAVTQLDPLVLHPEWSLEDQSTVLREVQRGGEGDLHTVRWGSYRAFSVPLRRLSAGDAAVIAWWWQTQAALALSLDRDDPASLWICRITNPRHPVGKRESPYADRWSGALALEGLDAGSLVY